MWPLASFGTTIRTLSVSLFLSASAYGVSAIVLPAYRFSAGLGSKLSRWLVPPIMNSQMTFLALGRKCGLPVGRAPAAGSVLSARATPSRCSIAPRPGR